MGAMIPPPELEAERRSRQPLQPSLPHHWRASVLLSPFGDGKPPMRNHSQLFVADVSYRHASGARASLSPSSPRGPHGRGVSGICFSRGLHHATPGAPFDLRPCFGAAGGGLLFWRLFSRGPANDASALQFFRAGGAYPRVWCRSHRSRQRAPFPYRQPWHAP